MNKKAFTLVELIATVTILGVVLLIAVPSYNKYVEKAEQTKCKADKEAIIDAAYNFIDDCIINDKCKDSENITYAYRDVKLLRTEGFLNEKYLKYDNYKLVISSIIDPSKDNIAHYTVKIYDESNIEYKCS